MNKVILNESKYKEAAKRATELASYFLAGNEDYLDNAIEMNRVGNELVGEVWDTMFHVFGVIASDTDHLPTQEVRSNCSLAMLKKADKEIESIINFYKSDVASACNEILFKYQNV